MDIKIHEQLHTKILLTNSDIDYGVTLFKMVCYFFCNKQLYKHAPKFQTHSLFPTSNSFGYWEGAVTVKFATKLCKNYLLGWPCLSDHLHACMHVIIQEMLKNFQ